MRSMQLELGHLKRDLLRQHNKVAWILSTFRAFLDPETPLRNTT